ncbi:MAG: glycoside hydrolase family 47 protein [Bacteroidota bacterium]
MRVPPCTLFVLLFALPTSAQPLDPQHLAETVKREFLHAWNGYKKYAWGHDGYRPLSKTPYDWYAETFYLTPLEALDTMTLMDLTEEADSTREFIATHLSFDKDVEVGVFEFTIRILGSLIANFQSSGDARLLALADSLATRMTPAFISGTGMPYRFVNLRTGAVRGEVSNPGEIGTLLVEWGSLSALTRKPAFYNYAKNALLRVYEHRSPLGLVGDAIDVNTGAWKGTDSHLSACIDSYYEYLVKSALLFDDDDCRLMWRTSYAAINAYLLDSSASGFWYGHADMNTGKRTRTWFGALDAFFPAVQVLAGDVPRAERLMKSCYRMWTAYGIEPEQFNYATGAVEKPKYFLNPEIIESAYYLYMATGDTLYQKMGEAFLSDLMAWCRTDEGYAELKNVVTKEKMDRMEPYFMAETMKYLYLLFAPPDTLPFDRVIFTTEAHPIRRSW